MSTLYPPTTAQHQEASFGNYSSQVGAEMNWIAMMLVPIPVWIFFGNLTVLVVIAEHVSLRGIWSNKIIFSLALTDMTIATIVMPFAAITQLSNKYWPFGFGICAFHVISDVYFCSSSIMHLLLIAINRYAAIGWPLSYRQVNMAVGWQNILLASVWCLPILIVAPLGIHIFFDPEGIYKEGHCAIFYNMFILYGSISTFYFPLLIMIAVDIRSFFLLRSKNKKSERLKRLSNGQRNANKSVHWRESFFSEYMNRIRLVLSTRPTSRPKENSYPPASDIRDVGTTSNNDVAYGLQTQTAFLHTRASSYPQIWKSNNNTYRNESPGKQAWNGILRKRRHSQLPLSTAIMTPVKNFFKRQRAETALLTVFVVFVICWMPFFTINVLQTIIPGIKEEGTLFLTFEWLGYCSSGLNPLIYPVFNNEYRKCFMRTFSGRRPSKKGKNDKTKTNATKKTQPKHESTSLGMTSPGGIEMRRFQAEFPRITSQTMSMMAISTFCMAELPQENSVVLEIPSNERLTALTAENDNRICLIDEDDTIVIVA